MGDNTKDMLDRLSPQAKQITLELTSGIIMERSQGQQFHMDLHNYAAKLMKEYEGISMAAALYGTVALVSDTVETIISRSAKDGRDPVATLDALIVTVLTPIEGMREKVLELRAQQIVDGMKLEEAQTQDQDTTH